MNNTEFENILQQQAIEYGHSLANIVADLSGTSVLEVRVGSMQKGFVISADCIVSIAFAGTVTGEFVAIFSFPEARKIFTNVSNDEEIRAMLSEALNMAAGARVGALAKRFDKVTICAPRTTSGQIHYPSVKNISIEIVTTRGSIQANFSIDQMKLDIAESYRNVISELKKINDELIFANSKLKDQQAQLVHSEKMASLGTMAAGVAHEINNPLAFVLSNTDVLGSYVDAMRVLLVGYEQLLKSLLAGNSTEARSELGKINEIKKKEDMEFVLDDTRKLLAESKLGLERIRAIVSGLKRFSRVDDGGIKSVKINEEIQNTLMLLQSELKYRCKVETHFESQRDIECLPGELSQVFVNLLVNAAQAVKPGSGVVEVFTRDLDDQLEIRVKDNGVGIAPENMEKIFSPFYTTKPVGEGTGLGLAITHGIIAKHSGSISVKSVVGEGTEFQIRIPFASHIKSAIAA